MKLDFLLSSYVYVSICNPFLPQLELYNMTEDVLWTSIDRGSYDDQGRYTPVPYTKYTGLTLQQTYLAFLAITLLHFIANFIMKLSTSPDFKEDSVLNKVKHLPYLHPLSYLCF